MSQRGSLGGTGTLYCAVIPEQTRAGSIATCDLEGFKQTSSERRQGEPMSTKGRCKWVIEVSSDHSFKSAHNDTVLHIYTE